MFKLMNHLGISAFEIEQGTVSVKIITDFSGAHQSLQIDEWSAHDDVFGLDIGIAINSNDFSAWLPYDLINFQCSF